MDERIRKIKDIQKELSGLNDLRTKYIFQLTHGKQMVHGLPVEVYRKCGKSNCRCARGMQHGPYPALSINKNGRQKIVMIKKSEPANILKEAKRYNYYRKTQVKIRKINKDIDRLLEELKKITTKTIHE